MKVTEYYVTVVGGLDLMMNITTAPIVKMNAYGFRFLYICQYNVNIKSVPNIDYSTSIRSVGIQK